MLRRVVVASRSRFLLVHTAAASSLPLVGRPPLYTVRYCASAAPPPPAPGTVASAKVEAEEPKTAAETVEEPTTKKKKPKPKRGPEQNEEEEVPQKPQQQASSPKARAVGVVLVAGGVFWGLWFAWSGLLGGSGLKRTSGPNAEDLAADAAIIDADATDEELDEKSNSERLRILQVRLDRLQAESSKHRPELARALNEIGVAWTDAGFRDKGLNYKRQALAMRRKLFGNKDPSHPSIIESLDSVGCSMARAHALQFHEEALQLMEQRMDTRQGATSQNLLVCARLLNNLGCAHTNASQGRVLQYQALETMTMLLDDKAESIKPRDRDLAVVKLNVASTLDAIIEENANGSSDPKARGRATTSTTDQVAFGEGVLSTKDAKKKSLQLKEEALALCQKKPKHLSSGDVKKGSAGNKKEGPNPSLALAASMISVGQAKRQSSMEKDGWAMMARLTDSDLKYVSMPMSAHGFRLGLPGKPKTD